MPEFKFALLIRKHQDIVPIFPDQENHRLILKADIILPLRNTLIDNQAFT
jgi:hypothetical protein